MLTSRNRGTFKGKIFASENQNTATLNGETELVPQDIKLLKLMLLSWVFISFNNFNFYDLIFEFIKRHYKELIDEFIRNHVEIIAGSKRGK